MTRITDELRELDPVNQDLLDDACDRPVFGELGQAIVAGVISYPTDEEMQPTPIGSATASWRASRQRHRRVRRAAVPAGLAAAAAVLVVIGAAGLGQATSGHPGRQATGDRPAIGNLRPSWKLVGDIGPSWQAVAGAGYEPGVYLVCPTTTTCYTDNDMVGTAGTISNVEVTDDAGQTWQQSELPLTLSGPSPLSCVDAETCAVLGDSPSGDATFLETTDGGQSWTTTAGPSELTSGIGVTKLSCTSSSACLAVASDPSGQTGAADAFATSNAGENWVQWSLPTDFVPRGVACTAAGSCVMTGFAQSPAGSLSGPDLAIMYTTDGGASWAAASLPDGLGPISTLSCSSSTDCLVTSVVEPSEPTTAVISSTDGGASWIADASTGLPAGAVLGASCSSSSDCWVGGFGGASSGDVGTPRSGFLASTSDGGESWQPATIPAGIGVIIDVTCPSSTTCFALGLQQSSGAEGDTFVLLSSNS